MTDAQFRLLRRMQDHSEQCFCASWLTGLEFILYEYAINEDTAAIPPEDAQELREVSERAGGWLVWRERDEAETFIPMPEWLAMFAEWRKSR